MRKSCQGLSRNRLLNHRRRSPSQLKSHHLTCSSLGTTWNRTLRPWSKTLSLKKRSTSWIQFSTRTSPASLSFIVIRMIVIGWFSIYMRLLSSLSNRPTMTLTFLASWWMHSRCRLYTSRATSTGTYVRTQLRMDFWLTIKEKKEMITKNWLRMKNNS